MSSGGGVLCEGPLLRSVGPGQRTTFKQLRPLDICQAELVVHGSRVVGIVMVSCVEGGTELEVDGGVVVAVVVAEVGGGVAEMVGVVGGSVVVVVAGGRVVGGRVVGVGVVGLGPGGGAVVVAMVAGADRRVVGVPKEAVLEVVGPASSTVTVERPTPSNRPPMAAAGAWPMVGGLELGGGGVVVVVVVATSGSGGGSGSNVRMSRTMIPVRVTSAAAAPDAALNRSKAIPRGVGRGGVGVHCWVRVGSVRITAPR